MPLLFLVAGLILIVTVVRGTTGQFYGALRDDISGGYLKWLAAILVIGILGYVKPLQEPSRYLLGLVALVILLTRGGGFISAFAQQISSPGTATPTAQAGGNPNLPAIPVQTQQSQQQQSGSSGSSGGGFNPSSFAGAFAAGLFL